MLLCDGANSANNVRVFPFGCCSTILKASGKPLVDFEAAVTFIETPEPYFVNAFVLFYWLVN